MRRRLPLREISRMPFCTSRARRTAQMSLFNVRMYVCTYTRAVTFSRDPFFRTPRSRDRAASRYCLTARFFFLSFFQRRRNFRRTRSYVRARTRAQSAFLVLFCRSFFFLLPRRRSSQRGTQPGMPSDGGVWASRVPTKSGECNC